MEKLNGADVGLSVNPQFRRPGLGGVVGDPYRLESLDAYALQSGSPLIDAGLNLTALFGLDAGGVDFAGRPFAGPAPEVGALESTAEDAPPVAPRGLRKADR